MTAITASWVEKGRNDGLVEGLFEGKVEALQLLRNARFGPPSDETEARIQGAAPADIDTWLRTAATADRLEAVCVNCLSH